jgi:glyoxalase family protein
MKLEGMHHITMITGDAQSNVAFYADTLGLRLVKKTVNFDAPEAYHLYFGDEAGSPGSILTWFEFGGARAGRAGAGMIHTIQLGVASEAALDFWAERLGAAGVETSREPGSLRFSDPEGLDLELVVAEVSDAPLIADHPEIPGELALQGFHAARAYASNPQASAGLLGALEFDQAEDGSWEARGESRGGQWFYDEPPAELGRQGAGTVHHIAWASEMDEHEAWREKASAGGARPTPVIDRFWFRSIYFREPSGVLFEIATLGPGFGVDEDADHLGESLILPPFLEQHRERIEAVLTPVVNPRTAARSAS